VTPHSNGSKASVPVELRVHAVGSIPNAGKGYLDNFARISESGGNDDAYETGGTWLVTPNFLSRLVALTNFVRLSLRKVAYVALGGTAM
jgi:hypothetical protein